MFTCFSYARQNVAEKMEIIPQSKNVRKVWSQCIFELQMIFFTLIFVLLLYRKFINFKTNQIFGVGVQILLKWRTNIWEIVHKYAWGWGGEGWGGNSVTKPFMRDIPGIKGWRGEYWLLKYIVVIYWVWDNIFLKTILIIYWNILKSSPSEKGQKF